MMVLCLEHPVHTAPDEARTFSCPEPTWWSKQCIITQLSFLQAWYHLCRLWMLSPIYTGKFGLCRSLRPFSLRLTYSMHRNARMLSKLILGVDRGVHEEGFPELCRALIPSHRPTPSITVVCDLPLDHISRLFSDYLSLKI